MSTANLLPEPHIISPRDVQESNYSTLIVRSPAEYMTRMKFNKVPAQTYLTCISTKEHKAAYERALFKDRCSENGAVYLPAVKGVLRPK